YLGFVFGNTVHAAATLIAIFLAGLGIGGYLFGRFFRKVRPLRLYAVLETAIGTIGALSPAAFELLDRLYVSVYPAVADAPAALSLLRILFAALFLLPPTILMGATLPVLVREFSGERLGSGRAVASLYSANTFGATAGVALSGFILIPTIGLTATVAAAVGLNLLLALGAAILSFRRAPELPEEPQTPAGAERKGIDRAWPILVASFLMGLSSIADEVFWSRILVLHLGSSVYAYSLMLFCFLIGIAIGSALVFRVISGTRVRRLLGTLEILLAITLALQVAYFTRFADVLESLAAASGARDAAGAFFVLLAATLSALLIPTAIMGATFPLVVRLYGVRAGRSETRSVGDVYLANTVGSIAGSLLAGFLLIRLLGSQNGLFAMAIINLGLGAWFLLSEAKGRGPILAVATGGAVLILSIILVPRDAVILSAGMFVDSEAPVLLFREDVSATVTLRELAPGNLSLELNGVNVAGTAPDLIGTQKLQGHLPLLLHPDPKSVLHIGFGSGGTAWAVSLHPVEEIVIAEISREVLEVSGSMLREVNHGVLDDPRVEAEINDGRNFVLADPRKFDVILSDSIHPRYAGNGSLYTKDYFELCLEKLAPGGIVSMWLPTYSLTERNYLMILRAFQDVFPNTTVWYVPNSPNAFTIVIGRTEKGAIPFGRLVAGIQGEVGEELAAIGIADAYDLAGALMIDPAGTAWLTEGTGPHIDDVPAVEYESGRLIDREMSWLTNFLLVARAMSPLSRAFSGVPDEARLEEVEAMRSRRVRDHLEWIVSQMRRERGGI
ncbi:MAG TPA: fused MFS/spermidine synthase, partial [Thermoanaerobaculia bacterium]|nr:fused MFS/spermidine synthase [Thermoanaerobaculia bacterium]